MDQDKRVFDFLNAFIEKPEPEIDKEYFELERKYENLFGHIVPREMLPSSISTDQIKSAIQECIDSKKDDLFTILGVDLNHDYLY